MSGDTRDIVAERERELHLAVYYLHGNEVVFLVVTSIVEEKTVSLSCCKPEIIKFTFSVRSSLIDYIGYHFMYLLFKFGVTYISILRNFYLNF